MGRGWVGAVALVALAMEADPGLLAVVVSGGDAVAALVVEQAGDAAGQAWQEQAGGGLLEAEQAGGGAFWGMGRVST